MLNMWGSDIPLMPHFHGYLFVDLANAILFIDLSNVVRREVVEYLLSINVNLRDYNDFWYFLKKREWGEGKVSNY